MTGRPVYHCPLGPEAEKAIDETWSELTGGHEGEPLTLTVNGRAVTIPRFHNGVARASFADLCEAPLGAGDYLAIAAEARTLLLDRAPRLGLHNANEAKRFVTLIDTLYEAKTRLVISAEAEPEALYPKGKGAFEFERTASRLAEMRSESWAAAA